MKKFLLKEISPDLAQILSMYYIVEVLIVTIMLLSAYRCAFEAFLVRTSTATILLTLLGYSLLASWPLLRANTYMRGEA